MGQRKSLKDAAEILGINRRTLGRWVDKGMVKTRPGQVRNLTAKLVDVSTVRKLVGDGIKSGRPKGKG